MGKGAEAFGDADSGTKLASASVTTLSKAQKSEPILRQPSERADAMVIFLSSVT